MPATLRGSFCNGHKVHLNPKPSQPTLRFERVLFRRNDTIIEANHVPQGNLRLGDDGELVERVPFVGECLSLGLEPIALEGDLPENGQTPSRDSEPPTLPRLSSTLDRSEVRTASIRARRYRA